MPDRLARYRQARGPGVLLAMAGISAAAWCLSHRSHAGDEGAAAKYETFSARGRIVWMDEALNSRFGVETDPDARQTLVALETAAGQLHPIIKDFRGRGFHKDPQLHELDLELLVRRYEGSPMIQVVRVYSWKEGAKYELDYWCDICAIPMYELKECECCQGPIRIRQRAVRESPMKDPLDQPAAAPDL